MSVRLVGVVSLVAVGGVAVWFLVRKPESVAPPPLPTPAPVVAEPEEVAVDVIPPPREIPPTPDVEFRATLNFVQSAAIHPDPRVAEAESKPVLDRIAVVRALLRERLPAAPLVEAQLKQLATEEAKYQQRLAKASDAWLAAFVEAQSRTAEKPGASQRTMKQVLRAFIKNPIREPNTAAADLAHLRRTQLEAMIHRAAGKDHGATSELVTEIMQLKGNAADRLEAIDDEEADAGVVHATWRGELAARFAKNPNDVTPAEIAAWLLSGCFPAAKPDKSSGADFAFLDPARNPELVKAAESGPVRRLLSAWATCHAKDRAAAAAAAALLTASEKK